MAESPRENTAAFPFKTAGKALGVIGALVAAYGAGTHQAAEERRSEEGITIVRESIQRTLSERIAHFSDQRIDVQMSASERMQLIHDYSTLRQNTAHQE